MDNITLSESALKRVVPEKNTSPDAEYYMDLGDDRQYELDVERGENQAIDKTLSTPLPLVEDCVFINDKGELEWKRI